MTSNDSNPAFSNPPHADRDEIRRTFDLFYRQGGVRELRALRCKPKGRGKPFTSAGCFDAVAPLVDEVMRLDREHAPEGTYFTLNPLKPELMARANPNRATDYAEMTAADGDVDHRECILIDFDPKRARGISANDDELAKASECMTAARALLGTYGWPEPVVCLSGNGYHLLYWVALPNDDDARELVRRVLTKLQGSIATEFVDVDQSVFNAGRITKVYGTVARKGAHMSRPGSIAQLNPTEFYQFVSRPIGFRRSDLADRRRDTGRAMWDIHRFYRAKRARRDNQGP